jgi:hypothetical protein
MAPLAMARQTLDVSAGQAFDAIAEQAFRFSGPAKQADASGLVDGRLPIFLIAFGFMLFRLLAGLLEVMLQLLFGVPPALPDSPHLLRCRGRVCMQVRTKVPRVPSVGVAHTGIVPLPASFRKTCCTHLGCRRFAVR